MVFLAVNYSDSRDVIEKYWKDEGFTLKAVQQDDSTVSDALGVQAYPTNYVLGPDGKVLWRSVGWNESAIRSALKSTAK